jgi:alpha-galactosidase
VLLRCEPGWKTSVLSLAFGVAACSSNQAAAPSTASGGGAGGSGGASVTAVAGQSGNGAGAGPLGGAGSSGGGTAPLESAAGGGAGGVSGAGGAAGKPPACHVVLPGSSQLLPKPPMGWSSARLGCSVDEASIKQLADTLVSSGLRDAGYEYVLVNDCWQTGRAADGSFVADAKFPSGLKNLADYLHSKQLKLGLGSSRGPTTCGGRPGSEGHEATDAAGYSAIGVDYVAIDNCNGNATDTLRKSQFTALIAAFAAKSLPLSIEPYADGQDIEGFQQWMQTANVFRNRGGISDDWASIISNIDSNADGVAYTRPGAFNDPGALQVGGKLTNDEYRAQMSLWAVMAAPLFFSAALEQATPATLATLSNPEVIAIDQDPLALAGFRVGVGGAYANGVEVWSKPLGACGARAVAFLNRGTTAADVPLKWAELGLAAGAAQLRDVWARADLAPASDSYTAHVPAHGAVLLEITGSELGAPGGAANLSDLPWLYAANSVGPAERDLSNNERPAKDGTPLSIAGHKYEKGLGVHAASRVMYRLNGACSAFSADAGVDDEASAQASVTFQVWADGSKLFDSGVVKGKTPAVPVSVDVTNKTELTLFVDNGGDDRHQDHVDWANARLMCK